MSKFARIFEEEVEDKSKSKRFPSVIRSWCFVRVKLFVEKEYDIMIGKIELIFFLMIFNKGMWIIIIRETFNSSSSRVRKARLNNKADFPNLKDPLAKRLSQIVLSRA